MKIVSKIHQKSIKNQWKWRPWGRPGTTLGVFGLMLVESDEFWPHVGLIFSLFRSKMAQDAFKMGSWAVLGSKFGLKMEQNRSQERSETLSIRWSIWRLIFEAIWSEFGSILGSKNLPKWSQVGCKIDPSLVLIWELFLKGFRYHFFFNFVHNIT